MVTLIKERAINTYRDKGSYKENMSNPFDIPVVSVEKWMVSQSNNLLKVNGHFNKRKINKDLPW